MRILHTADWHVGKKLGRLDRRAEAEAVLDELVAIAAAEKTDLVLVAGDLFDRGAPPLDYLRLVLETLVRLGATGAQVVALPGNHDSAELFRVLRPLLANFGVHVVDRPLEPDGGGIVTIPARDGETSARIACLPFVHEVQVIDLMGVPEEGYKSYADRIRKINAYYAKWMVDHHDPAAVDVLMGHFMVHGAVPSGTERELHIGEAYMATADAIPASIAYAALGHIHRPQEAPGSAVPSRYAGSLMQLDFGEAGQEKSVCIVDVTPARPAQVGHVPITSGKQLVKVSGTVDELRARADELKDAILHVSVPTDGPSPGLAEEVREILPNALHVVADYERTLTTPAAREGASLEELYSGYVERRRNAAPPEDLMDAFRSLVDEVGVSL